MRDQTFRCLSRLVKITYAMTPIRMRIPMISMSAVCPADRGIMHTGRVSVPAVRGIAST